MSIVRRGYTISAGTQRLIAAENRQFGVYIDASGLAVAESIIEWFAPSQSAAGLCCAPHWTRLRKNQFVRTDRCPNPAAPETVHPLGIVLTFALSIP